MVADMLPKRGLNPSKPPTMSGTRRWASRSRTGCLTCRLAWIQDNHEKFELTDHGLCRIRRVKCDEEKPHCRRCMSTGRDCDGYEQQPCNQSARDRLILYKSSLPVKLFATNDEENQHFQFFRTTTILHFAGYLDASFWTRKLLQASHTFPAIWHAITALGAMHRRFIIDQTASLPLMVAGKQMKFALRQFNISIQHLLQTWPSEVPDNLNNIVVLTASVLFTCLCSLQGQHSQAIMHIKNGLKLFHETNKWTSEMQFYDDPVSVDVMSLIFSRWDTQVRTLLDDHSLHVWPKKPVDFTRLKDRFECLIQAYADLEILLNGLIQLVQGRETDTSDAITTFVEERRAYSHHFAAWDKRLADYLSRCTEVHWREALPLLQLRRQFADVLLKFDPTKGELAWDDFHDSWGRMLDLASKLLYTCENAIRCQFGRPGGFAQEDGIASAPVRPHFSLMAGIIELLYTIALRCREPNIRRRALRILKGRPRREGIWESTFAARVVEAVLLKEESIWQGHAKICMCVEGITICEDHRLRTVKVISREERKVTVSLQTVEECRLLRPGTKVLITW